MMEGLLPSMKNTDEDDYFMKPREKVDDDSGTVGIICHGKVPSVVKGC